jgi:hypothetical protein
MEILDIDLPAVAPVVVPAIAALLLVASSRLWPVLRTVITIAHEGGHVVIGLLVGRRLRGIRLHSDSSGVTLSRGRPTGPGMVATAFAGYVAPSVAGLATAALVAVDQHAALLVIVVVLLAAMLIAIRNVFGVVAIVATGAVLVAARWYAPEPTAQATASVLAWFLLFGGLRAVTELQRTRRSPRSRDSDADQLARLTSVPAIIWVALFALIAIGALVASTALLLRA